MKTKQPGARKWEENGMEITTVRAHFAKVFAASFPSRQTARYTGQLWYSPGMLLPLWIIFALQLVTPELILSSIASAEDPTLFRLTTSVLGRKNLSINSLYQNLVTIKTHESCIFCNDGLLSSDRGDSEAANGYGASGAITLKTKLTSPKKSFGQSRFATGGFSASWRWFAAKHFSFHCISKYIPFIIKVESLQRHIFIQLTVRSTFCSWSYPLIIMKPR